MNSFPKVFPGPSGPTGAGCEHRDDDTDAEGYSPSPRDGSGVEHRPQRSELLCESFGMSDVHPNVTRVVAAATALGLDIEPRNFGHAKTAIDAANVIGVDVGQIVKSLIFAVDGEVVLAYVSGSNQLDEAKLAHAAGGAKCARVDADVVREVTGFPIGGVPPFGSTTHLRVFVDPDLLQYDEVWAAAGTWHDVFGIEPHKLVEASEGLVTDLKRG
jgi:prolyl-tRNA editing enzyme YbaK/EbsC (Cys-tRNA(Pro) deacylase)